MRVVREAVGVPRFDLSPLQLGMPSPWHVVVASVLLCRAKRKQIIGPLQELFARWPTPTALACSRTEELEEVLRPCGLHRSRTRQLQRLASRWDSDWSDPRELPGVGDYVSDCVRVFCFGEITLTCSDGVLTAYVQEKLCLAT